MLAYQPPSPNHRASLRRRASGFALALAINLLLLLLLWQLGVVAIPLPKATSALVVDFIPAQSAAPSHAVKAATKAKATTATRPVQKPRPRITPEKPKLLPTRPLDMIEMSSADLAAGNISKLPKSGDSGAGDSKEVGRGPNGEVLYAAEWARHPTDAELGGYLPKNAPDGFGLIACKTIPDDRVDDCVELDQQPLGSHLASAVRQAAWQFRVRPPRKNGKELIGSWVRIRIDYYTSHSG